MLNSTFGVHSAIRQLHCSIFDTMVSAERQKEVSLKFTLLVLFLASGVPLSFLSLHPNASNSPSSALAQNAPRVEVVKIGKYGLTLGDVRRDVYLVKGEQLQVIDKSRKMVFAPRVGKTNPLNQRVFLFDGEECKEESVDYEDLFKKYKRKKNLRRLWTKRYTPDGVIYTFTPPFPSKGRDEPGPEEPEIRFCVTLTTPMMRIGGADESRPEGMRYFNNTLSLAVFWSPW
ncbi:hypothetical protein TGPRC2_212160 [Toxoplasma gondii TgCatPRC2]|uniref:Uncharacterized protein n=5 Tax=Toxoplasma gondii TaxID=5811 RepID=A0A151HQX9_TOXGO|nr:hypothetical protein TGME49_212160 [Toxoplasma gondii ME49]KFG45880.1 hypothetical protein TGDOM2_212160 [Toxoplasma gondii GAB2-2007-GAL-DOM2]KFH13679.1 hypothetical protein TGVAND_212160 [Toxoplasma gondii VAND]KYK71631.1 hypothetical protein TGPRC2_212160 [Toxoplasma gondii TgCatPRC2]PIM03728.1 hypothetical protein TGCOUG_212160 [Toxoplasma gondii COUG]EPT26831.1 hypothetical protein TGME49_212160 [Toxoplasma gondii ME49]|eukprot:XP_018635880.1 hypothetical protein TGME49_212160 [Toxoplasma gondii ME49]